MEQKNSIAALGLMMNILIGVIWYVAGYEVALIAAFATILATGAGFLVGWEQGKKVGTSTGFVDGYEARIEGEQYTQTPAS